MNIFLCNFDEIITYIFIAFIRLLFPTTPLLPERLKDATERVYAKEPNVHFVLRIEVSLLATGDFYIRPARCICTNSVYDKHCQHWWYFHQQNGNRVNERNIYQTRLQNATNIFANRRHERNAFISAARDASATMCINGNCASDLLSLDSCTL